MLPDTSQMDPKDLCDTGLPRADGRGTVKLFSSLNPAVVRQHMVRLARAGIDGVALQRFVAGLEVPQKRRRMDQVLRNVLAAAQSTGRVVYITYDVSGTAPDKVAGLIQADWSDLQQNFALRREAAYLKENGKLVLQLWGFGFTDRPGQPAEVAALVAALKQSGSYVIGGVPTHWRTLAGDAKTDPAWAPVYRSYDAISPWTVGRYTNGAGADKFFTDVVRADMAEARRAGVRYMPVVFPGFSWFNLMKNRGNDAVINQIPRECGSFLERQIDNVVTARAETMYVAMLDEFDEATALLPGELSPARVPAGAQTLAGVAGQCGGGGDRYLKVTGRGAGRLRAGQAAEQ
ncbi:MAG: glycoside hydrolase family 71/99-like protein [Massilia sp.]